MSEKRFEATPQRLKKAREGGMTAKSSLLTQFFVVFGMLISTVCAFNIIWVDLEKMVKCSHILDIATVCDLFSQALIVVVEVVGICLMVAVVLAMISEGGQIGFSVESKPLAPQFSRISPCSQIKNLPQRFKDFLVKSLSVFFVLFFSYRVVVNSWDDYSFLLFAANGETILDYVVKQAKAIFYYSLISFLLASLLDLYFSKKRFKKNTLMSLEEIKEEYKELEGNQQMKQARSQAHQELLYEEVVRRVKRSKVIVVATEEVC